MFGKNNKLTKCFVFTTNFEPIVKQSVANNTLLSQIFVNKPIYFYILDLYFRTGKNRVLDLYFRTEGVFWISCFPLSLGARIRHVDMKLDMTIGNPKWNSKKQYYFFIILAIVQDIYIDYRKFVCTYIVN